jgi:transcriptional regulator with XRE-family HTH domain
MANPASAGCAVLDVARIADQRAAIGLSQRALAREAGLSATAISTLERGGSQAELTLRVIDRLAKALGVQIAWLFDSPERDQRASAGAEDDLTVEALLASAPGALTSRDVARILGWTLVRAKRALRDLERRLEQAGTLLHRSSNGCRIRPRTDLLDADVIERLERVRLRNRQARESAMRLLLAIVRDPLPVDWEQRASNADRVNLQMLVKAGLVARAAQRVYPTPELLESLGLVSPQRVS